MACRRKLRHNKESHFRKYQVLNAPSGGPMGNGVRAILHAYHIGMVSQGPRIVIRVCLTLPRQECMNNSSHTPFHHGPQGPAAPLCTRLQMYLKPSEKEKKRKKKKGKIIKPARARVCTCARARIYMRPQLTHTRKPHLCSLWARVRLHQAGGTLLPNEHKRTVSDPPLNIYDIPHLLRLPQSRVSHAQLVPKIMAQ